MVLRTASAFPWNPFAVTVAYIYKETPLSGTRSIATWPELYLQCQGFTSSRIYSVHICWYRHRILYEISEVTMALLMWQTRNMYRNLLGNFMET